VLSQPLGAAGVGGTGVQNGFHQREFGGAIGQARAADDIADHIHIGLQRHLICAKTFDEFNAQGTQLVTHGRVDASVAAGDLVARLACQGRQAAHKSAADPENVYMHARILR
jgi:hypothetical protein